VKIYVAVTCHLGPKIWQYFVPNKREFVITVIVITEFDCNSKLHYFSKHYVRFLKWFLEKSICDKNVLKIELKAFGGDVFIASRPIQPMKKKVSVVMQLY